MRNLIAVQSNPLGNLEGIGNIGLEGGGNAIEIFAKILSTTIGLLTVIGALFFMFNLITGAIGIISAGGDKGALEDARKKITIGAVGFVVVVAGMFIMDLIATIIGIPNILNLQEMIDLIRL